MRKYLAWTILATAFLSALGCQHCGSPPPCPPGGVASAYGPSEPWWSRSRLFHPLTPRASVAVPPPGTVAVPPPGAIVIPPGGVPAAPAPVTPAPAPITPALPAPAAPDVRSYAPPTEPNPTPAWRPSPEAGERLVPEGAPPRPGGEQSPAPPAMPEGIPGFAMLKKNVAAGQRPTHLEGLEWLKANGYRMALYIRAPGESDDADRKQFEDKLGMKFASLTLSPEALTLDVVDQFNHIVTDPSSRPLFVYDKDGSLAGALWYLHFRMIDQQSDEQARTAAARLGLKETNAEMWVAIQRILSGKR